MLTISEILAIRRVGAKGRLVVVYLEDDYPVEVRDQNENLIALAEVDSMLYLLSRCRCDLGNGWAWVFVGGGR